jgi:hypothetical protein
MWSAVNLFNNAINNPDYTANWEGSLIQGHSRYLSHGAEENLGKLQSVDIPNTSIALRLD